MRRKRMSNKAEGVIIEGLNVIEIVKFLGNKNKKYLAITLNNIEDVLDPNSEDYKLIRKEVLDGFNEFTRAIVEVLFGDQLEK
jgi:hypothetical protein